MIDGRYIYAPAVSDVPLPNGATTGAGLYRKVLVSMASDGTYGFVVGVASAGSQDAAVKPAAGAGSREVGWIELPPNFAGGTLTRAMLQQAPTGAVEGIVASVNPVGDHTTLDVGTRN